MLLAEFSLMYGSKSVRATVCPVVLCSSSANWLAAASIWRRLLMQALACEVARAFTKFGMAMAARRPIMATTIMISTRVKPAFRMFLVSFIVLLSFFPVVEQNGWGGLMFCFFFLFFFTTGKKKNKK